MNADAAFIRPTPARRGARSRQPDTLISGDLRTEVHVPPTQTITRHAGTSLEHGPLDVRHPQPGVAGEQWEGFDGPDPILADWQTWLGLSSTPPVTSSLDTRTKLWVHGGLIGDEHTWPSARASRIYVVFDDEKAVYVGQTRQPLLSRVRTHFRQQRTDDQRRKAGTWRFIVTAAFDDLHAGDLDTLERHAAEWLLPLRHRQGRRHPRQS